MRDNPRSFHGCLGQDDAKLVAAISGDSIDRAATGAQRIAEPAKCPVAGQVAVAIIDLLQSIQVEQQQGKRSSGAPGSFDLRVQNVKDPAVIAQAGKRVGHRQELRLLFSPLAFRDVESGNQRGRHAIKLHPRRRDIKATLRTVFSKNLELCSRGEFRVLLVQGSSAYYQFSRTRTDKIFKING